MAARFIQKISAFTAAAIGVRDLPNATPFQYDQTDDQLKFLDENGVVRTAAAPANPVVLAAAARTIVAADRGRMFIDTLGSGTTTFQLPTAAAMPGAEVTLVNGSAAGEILVNPNAADQLSIKGLVDHSTSVKPVAGTGVKNTAATNVLGDHLTLRSDGVNTWHEVSGAGIWASQ